MDKLTIKLSDIELSQLNNESLRLVALYARKLKAKTGIALKMQDKDILVQISNNTRKIKDPEFSALYAQLKRQVLESVHQSMVNTENS